jgi:D-alanine-D-alanine ligase
MKEVVVLKGGWNGEREVSLTSGKEVEKALLACGYKVRSIDAQRNLQDLIAQLTPKPDVVFNALHGEWGEDGTIQSLLDIMAIPYTHSGTLASAVAMEKPFAKQMFALAGIKCPQGYLVPIEDALNQKQIPKPFIVKPKNQGSTLGIYIVKDGFVPNIDLDNWSYGPEVMVEEFIEGHELSVAVMGDRALGVTELRALSGFYDYEAKYTDGKTEHITPAQIPADVYQKALEVSLKAHQILGCKGLSRVDLRYNPNEKEGLYVLEINTQPGLTPLSIAPDIAEKCCGISFQELVKWMVENAQCKM